MISELTLALLLLAALSLGGITLFILKQILHRSQARQYEQDILFITIPQFSGTDPGREQQVPARERLAHVETLFATLASLHAQRGLRSYLYGRTDHFALEMVAQNGTISFYAALPKGMSQFFIQQVQAVYPHAYFEPVVDYNIFQPQGAILGGYLVQRRSFVFPIKTYMSLEHDPLEAITAALSKIPTNGGAAVQLILRSAHKSWHSVSRKIISEAYKGTPLDQALKHNQTITTGFSYVTKIFSMLFSIFGATFTAQQKKSDMHPLREPQGLSPKDQPGIKSIEEKNAKGGFDVNLRVVVAAPNAQLAEQHLANIMNAFGQYSIYEYGNAFKPLYVGSQEKTIQNFIYRHFEPRAAMLLNSEEITSIFHLPQGLMTPHINWLKAKKAPPPVDMPTEGILIGRSVYRNESIDVRIKDADRRRHMYIIGQTGVGKSVLMQSMAIQDIQRGKGVCVIDPHGDLIDTILSTIPDERANDVIVFDPADTDRPLALNMLEFHTPEQKTFVVNEMINIFDKLYDLKTTGGPMFEQYMRNTMLLMMEDPSSGSTLLEIPKVLADDKFRKFKLSKATNPVVRDFWEKEAQKAGGDASLANMVPYITSKLNQFITNDIMRPIISQQKSSFNFRQVMDEQKILLINLSKGRIGETNSALLGMVIVGKILMGALSRVDIPEESRKDFYLYVDEFQNFVTESIAIILSEARKYKLNLTMAHQYINQLVKNNNTSVRDAVFGNVGTMVAFRVGPDDAEALKNQFAPVFDAFDLINIDKYNCYVRLLVDNQNPPPFSCAPIKPAGGDPKRAHLLRERSRNTYGRPREIVEQEILERTKIAYPAPTPLPPIA